MMNTYMAQRQRLQQTRTQLRDREVTTFATKAPRYCRALDIAPMARALELAPLLHILRGVVSRIGGGPRVLDAMAGSGYLTQYLGLAGAREVVAAEACRPMADRIDRGKAKVVNIKDDRDLPGVVTVSGSKIVVSLAAFHHLVVPQDANDVDRVRSAKRQAALVRKIFASSDDVRYVIIADVPATPIELVETGIPWSDEVADIVYAGLDVMRFIPRAQSLWDYRAAMQRTYMDLPADNAGWFRRIVHSNSDTGHRDAFLGTEIIEELRGEFALRGATVPTPWVFSDHGQAEAFFWDKFAFRSGSYTPREVLSLAAQYLGMQMIDGFLFVGWQLSFLVIERAA